MDAATVAAHAGAAIQKATTRVTELTGQPPGCPVDRDITVTIYRIPIQTLGLLLTVIGLYYLVPDHSLLYFNASNIAQGETWRIVTGHLIHSDTEHLFWNSLGLVVLGTMIERRSPALWWAALGAGIAAVSILLMTPFTQLDNYCGMSGLLNSLLLVAIWIEWRMTRSWLVVAVACGSFVKVVVEITVGASLLTHISWPPYAWSHAAGLTGGLIVVWAALSKSSPGYRWWQPDQPVDKPVPMYNSSAAQQRKTMLP
jgi:rhomboid family GlyGly-CTERM serine protease